MKTRVLEHCDEKGMEHCDYKGHGAWWRHGSWGILMKGVVDRCDERGDGAL